MINRKEGTEDYCCGLCRRFQHEDIDGYGFCALDGEECHCSECCKELTR